MTKEALAHCQGKAGRGDGEAHSRLAHLLSRGLG